MTSRVLIADDDARVLAGFRRRLGKRFDLRTAESGAEALRRLSREGPFAAVVVDMRMPGMDGIRLLKEICRQAPETVRIMLTGDTDQRTAVEAINHGRVFRFLNKPCTSEDLAEALDDALEKYESAKKERRLARLARYDHLTGVANRALFMKQLSQALARARRSGGPLALLFLDLDGFKAVNDTLGHDAGDMLLKTVAERLQSCTRGGDTVARFGGDEFTIVAEGLAHETDATIVARKILDVLTAPIQLAGREVRPGVSVGVATHPSCGDEAETLIKRADTAMYRAKRSGGGRYSVYATETATR